MTTLTTNTPSNFGGLFGAIRTGWKRRQTYHRVYNELSMMSDRDLADIGVNRGMITTIADEAARDI